MSKSRFQKNASQHHYLLVCVEHLESHIKRHKSWIPFWLNMHNDKLQPHPALSLWRRTRGNLHVHQMLTYGYAVMASLEDCSGQQRKKTGQQEARTKGHSSKRQAKQTDTRKCNIAEIVISASVYQTDGSQAAVVGLKGSIRLNLTFFTGSYKKTQQTWEGQLQHSAKQLTGDLAQQRFLPRCPTLFFAWSLCCSTPPRFSWWPHSVLVVPIKLFIWP